MDTARNDTPARQLHSSQRPRRGVDATHTLPATLLRQGPAVHGLAVLFSLAGRADVDVGQLSNRDHDRATWVPADSLISFTLIDPVHPGSALLLAKAEQPEPLS
jgi:hypothetical protein